MEFIGKVKQRLKKSHLLNNASVIVINTVMDSPAWLGASSAILSYAESKTASYINALRSLSCFLTRFITECSNAGYDLKISARIKNYAKNQGASFKTGAVVAGLSSIFACAGGTPGDLNSYIPAATLAIISLINLSFAASFNRNKQDFKQKFMDVATMATINGMHIMATAGDRPWPLVLIFGASVASTVALAVTNTPKPKGLMQPYYFTMGGCFMNAALSHANDSPIYTATNIGFGLAFIMLDKMKKHKGMAQAIGLKPKLD